MTEHSQAEHSPSDPRNLLFIQKAFPQLEILELLGRGGMGDVFKARQIQLDRFVALKILSADPAKKPSFAKRFAREGKILAKLNHPNIVTIYDFGQTSVVTPDGTTLTYFYLILEYVDGMDLRRAISEQRVTPSQSVAITSQVCSALQYAHSEGVLHRDIKPANILLDPKGCVKITDFGIGKLMLNPQEQETESDGTPSDVLTQAGMLLGTPKYMAPEQLENPNQVDHRADIYSLGLVFYELLTGVLPSHESSATKTEFTLSKPMDTVVYKAIKRDRSERYQSAEEFRAVVEDILQARERQKAAKMKNALLTLIICTLILAMMLVAGGGLAWWYLNMQNGSVQNEPKTTIADIQSPEHEIEPPPVNPLLQKNIEVYDAGQKAEELKETLKRLSGVSPKRELQGCRWWTVEYALNEQGTLLATGTSVDDCTARIWDLKTLLPKKEMPHTEFAWIEAVAFHPVLPRLFTAEKNRGDPASTSGDVYVWSTETCEKLTSYAIPRGNTAYGNKAFRLAVSNDGNYLIVGTMGGKIFALNGETGEVLRKYQSKHNGEIRAVAFHPDNKMFATIGSERTICFWDVDQEESVRSIPYSIAGKPNCLYFSTSGSRIVVSAEFEEMYALVYEVDSGELLANYGGYGGRIMVANFSSDERFVITGDNNGCVVIWDALTKKPVWADSLHPENHIYRVFLTPSQERLIVGVGWNPRVYEMPPEIHKK